MTTIVTQEAKHSPELTTAVERALAGHDLRIKAGLDIGTVLDTLTANGVTAEAKYGSLALTMNGAPVHVADVIEGLAKQRTELFYPRETQGVKSRDELDLKGRVDYIRQFGADAFARLPQSAPKEQIVVLDPNRMTREQWLSLPIKQRAELSSRWKPEQIGAVMARRSK